MEQHGGENTRGTREVLSGIIGTWIQAKTTGEMWSISDTWLCGMSSMVIMTATSLVARIMVNYSGFMLTLMR